MSRPAIIVDGISKQYRIGLREQQHRTFREAIVGLAAAPLRRFQKLREKTNGEDTFWALKDVSFEVQPGEVVGIIGRNGAGKSTLLKILSRITEPTAGTARLRGRVASLLEVGTGFHPELTGRENVYLNGAILGMKKAEIDRKFDEIVAFAEIDKFLDTPVKRYSSGMYVRLAFAVAAHLEPEILVVDEVLAVGDAEFQKRCLGKMREVAAGQGRTVLFVSHNMAAVQKLCERVVYLHEGAIADIGRSTAIIGAYLSGRGKQSGIPLHERRDREGSGEIRLTGLSIDNGDPTDSAAPYSGCCLHFRLEYEVATSITSVSFHIGINDLMGVQILHLSTRSVGTIASDLRGRGHFVCTVPRLPLPPSRYLVNVAILGGNQLVDRVESAMELDVEPADYFGSGDLESASWGKVLVDHSWTRS